MGSRGLNESYRFHFDGYAVTALLPIVIPTGEGPSGDLIMFPNTRRVRKSAAVNVLEKAVYQNRYSQRMAAWLVRRGVLKPTKLRLVPGNIYLFWGYRTLHANEACLADRLRTTALFHFGDPHGGSGLVGAVNARASDRGVRARAA
ncbi:hypothetical protein SAMN05216548_112120 [Faunimonas pinastri]|uniref:Uncharacterized protein n=2 Tax=Faunimonas pinastri TaxID=1855383 RepID=A0A1H9M3I5_9HYPH|nr:hypothetical protein SAMN05216548_112120 [Faunimonas pinastri]